MARMELEGSSGDLELRRLATGDAGDGKVRTRALFEHKMVQGKAEEASGSPGCCRCAGDKEVGMASLRQRRLDESEVGEAREVQVRDDVIQRGRGADDAETAGSGRRGGKRRLD